MKSMRGECFAIDDDILAFFIIFVTIMGMILLALNAVVSSTQPPAPPTAQVLALVNNDLIHKQIISMPMTIPSAITDTTSANFLFYIYNPMEQTQQVNVTWWLGMQLDKNYVVATINGTEIALFVLPANQTAECLLSFSLRPNATQYVKEQFKNAGSNVIYFDLKSEFV